MELKFITNDYVLAWNLLFQPSYTTELNNIKQKLWDNYKIVKMTNIEALDAGVAAYEAYNRLLFFTSFYQFFGNCGDAMIQPKVLICNEQSEFRKISIEPHDCLKNAHRRSTE